MVSFCLVVFPHRTGKRLSARRLCRTNTQLRSPRFTHLDERVKVMAPLGCLSSLFHSGRGLSPSAVRDEAMCNSHHGMGHFEACRALAWCLLCAWSCFLVSWHDTRSQVVQSRVGHRAFHPRPPLDTQHKLPLRPCSLPVPRITVPAYCTYSRSQKHKPHQHGLRRHDHVVPDIEPECGSCLTQRIYFVFARQCKYEHGQKPNHQHHALGAAMSSDEGLKIKHHTSCVATHIVRLLATCPASGQETARFGRDHGLPSNTRQKEAQRSCLVRWR